MKIGLIGFGKAGKAVANVILQNTEFSLEWVLKNSPMPTIFSASEFLGVNSEDQGLIYSLKNITVDELLDMHPVDIIIDFSSTDSIFVYGKMAAERKVTIISAISHYGDVEKELLRELSKETIVFWSPNITLGVNYLMFASGLLKNIVPDVDIEVIEEHFKAKEGVSGTALKIAEKLDLEKENINSVRAGGIVGKHEVVFGFPYQTVRLVHESISREAFGNGALFAARELADKPKGLYNFEDILRPYFEIKEG
ncbi:Dihydrodipicolinate reductase [Chryseobacterium nakagawai]|uniref:4-hydroxy-tetrahydrodipicolinate reductase n=1 Tax=Chryseobacterium nakagawai TaxID=1241982 RepID=A0AAD0YTW2_CHRNA|nr:dihydrodipicolinate reductase C-terminal domain-containing protein [Chryseobacterium nakagawai]AZA92956.1 dihydrodipicolinate reductase [Chryseobacterium nakagawai]VEH19581.1 Dihydrodipicolinate reductase [Chryseobacterium nakagawai]